MTVLSATAAIVRSGLVRLGFWTAIALPLGYFYLLYNGLTGPELVRLIQLVGLHAIAFVVGRGYNARSGTEQPVSTYGDRNRTV